MLRPHNTAIGFTTMRDAISDADATDRWGLGAFSQPLRHAASYPQPSMLHGNSRQNHRRRYVFF